MRILVVEDNEDNLALLEKVLKHGGHRVSSVRTGREALEAAPIQMPDLILMDLGLPEMDGWEATRALRKLPALASTPVLALTAHALRKQDRQRALEAGCAEYITKPFDWKSLLSVVERYAPRSRGERDVQPQGG